MSDRPLIKPDFTKPLIAAGDMSGNVTSNATIIQRLPGISYDVSWTGTPTGVFSVQVSNSYAQDAEGNVLNAGNWTTLNLSGTPPTPSGSPGNGFIDIVGTEAYAIRIMYTRTSGTGTLTVLASAKVW